MGSEKIDMKRRIYKSDVGNMPKEEAEKYISNLIAKYRQDNNIKPLKRPSKIRQFF